MRRARQANRIAIPTVPKKLAEDRPKALRSNCPTEEHPNKLELAASFEIRKRNNLNMLEKAKTMARNMR